MIICLVYLRVAKVKSEGDNLHKNRKNVLYIIMFDFNKRVVSAQKILDNLSVFKSMKICAMVKANAYGFGLPEMVKLLSPHVEFFGVANVKEALEVRRLSSKRKILLVGKNYEPYICKENNISYAVTNVTDALYAPNKSNVHLKIDSGMHRLGFNNEDEFLTAISILRDKDINIEGVYTHFATLDCDDEYFHFQYERFKQFLKVLPKDINPLIHVGGSWALAKEIPEADMIRIGKGIYHGTISVESRIIRTFSIKAGERVGYANSFIAKKDMKVGIVPVGYADGLKRCLANRYDVLIKDKKCRIIGNICMDMFAVDISNVDAYEGSPVVVLYDEAYMAKKLKTSSYEVTTNFNHLRGKTVII